MNVIYISSIIGRKTGGVTYSLINQIKSQSLIDNVYWLNLQKTEIIKNENKYHYQSIWSFDIKKLPKPFDNPDLVVCEEFFKWKVAVAALKLKKMHIPYIIIPHSQMSEAIFQRKKVRRKIACKILFDRYKKNCKAVHFLTSGEKNNSTAYYGGEYVIIPNGINVESSYVDKKSNKLCGIYIGRFQMWQKGLDILLDAIVKQKKILEDNNVCFKLFGPNDDYDTKGKLEKIVIDNGLEEIVSINDVILGDEKKLELEQADFFILTSRFEGMPIAVLEALAYGLPCILTEGTNMSEEIANNDAGWSAINSSQSVANAIESLLEQKELLSYKSENARKLAKKYNWNNIAIRTHEEYSSIISNSGR